MMPIEECSERIERLLARVQQTHREYAAHRALTSPRAPTRFDARPGQRRQQPAAAQRTVSTASTASLQSASSMRSDSCVHQAALLGVAGDGGGGQTSPRRRAVTMGPTAEAGSGGPAQRTPIEEMRAKIERRARMRMAGPGGGLRGDEPGAEETERTLAAARLEALRRENDALQRTIEDARRAVEALTRVVLGRQ
ncbi:hypothetical protein H4R18_004085 [Coemansia javaensis]|uniref:Uncharacterized protein n=1 Tax=Coemansia javaensis TaxID=2761396 RepID=A0A9W8H779_9FUNG|nr:hypothetical protein H4R18_004085 [Coemansia javaensis]